MPFFQLKPTFRLNPDYLRPSYSICGVVLVLLAVAYLVLWYILVKFAQ